MLSHKILTRSDLNATGRYYADAEDDYYTKDMDASQWQGKGADRLGLAGPVDRKRFQQLLAGQVKPGIEITRSATRKDAKERIGIDFTFSAPKSVSIQALVGGDSRLIKAHEDAVTATLNHMEMMAQARVKTNGKVGIVDTGNLIVAKFRHETSREQDPQLHTHAVVMNLTRRADGQWRALRNDKIIKSVSYLGAHYRAELASRLVELGFELRNGPNGTFELAHIEREQLLAFSKRTHAIEAELAKHDMNRVNASSAEKQIATLATRRKKEVIDRDVLWQRWQETAREAGIQLDREASPEANVHENSARVAERMDERAIEKAAEKAVRYAIHHLTERETIIKKTDLMKTATDHGVGHATGDDVERILAKWVANGKLLKESPLYRAADDLKENTLLTRKGWEAVLIEKGATPKQAVTKVEQGIHHGRLVLAEARYTTQGALARERAILNMERAGRGRGTPVIAQEAGLAQLANSRLNDKQRAAAVEILSAPHRVLGVQGLAGTGKTTMLSAAKELAEKAGYRMVAVAPYGTQVKALQANGFEAKTVMSFINSKRQFIDDKTILVVDEAGVMPARLMEQTLRQSEKEGARVVLVGDTGQTKAIEAGKPFDQLQESGMHTITLDHIIRQREPQLKSAVVDAAHGRSVDALMKIRDVVEISGKKARWKQIVNDYMSMSAEDRAETLVISGSNAARKAINKLVRDKEQRSGYGEKYKTLNRLDTTRAERQFAKNYEHNYFIQPERDYKKIGLMRGEIYQVIDTGPHNKLTVEGKDRQLTTFSPMVYSNLSVYKMESKEIVAGDRVRITRNDAVLDVANGDRFTVVEADKAKIVLSNGERTIRLPTEKPLHLDYAYVSTVHSAQGLTCKHVLYEANSKSPITSREVFYVAISRAREKASIYTDSVENLPDSVARELQKTAATELIREKSGHVRQAEQWQIG